MDHSIGAYVAKTHLSSLLDRVEHGESLTITRNGQPVARLVPVQDQPVAGQSVAEGLRAFRERLRAKGVGATQAEIKGWIAEGRR